jgi:hypothetical protein
MADQQDPLKISLPLDQFVREVAREAARTVMQEHTASCAIGSGTLGGVAGALLSRVF